MKAVFDAHLDLAFGAQLGRDLTLSLDDLRENDPVAGQTACVTFSELRRANVAACFGTLFACPASDEYPQGYDQSEKDGWKGARRQAMGQLDQYRRWQDAGRIRLLHTGAEVAEHVREWRAELDSPLGVTLLMEGADPLESARDLDFWKAAGVRLIGPAWGRTRYAGGTDAPGPLSGRGQELLIAMQEAGVALEASHLDDASFGEAVALQPKVIASHSNSRALVSGNRHLSDEMALSIAVRGGVIGLVGHSKFIRPDWQEGDARATFAEWAAHAEHYAGLVGAGLSGWEHIGLGSDLDGGFGLEKAPASMEEYADVLRLLYDLPQEAREGVQVGNWLRWAEANL
ncbi:dipeptidase [Deinococcus sp.]|uniref:dipeptidase n=1 Tax=Deinococcus sp. TaxID=47478 RepID=UPI003C7B52C8